MTDDREWKLTDKKLKPSAPAVLVSDLWQGLLVFVLGFTLGRCSYHVDVRWYP
jgi:hypothetical protein